MTPSAWLSLAGAGLLIALGGFGCERSGPAPGYSPKIRPHFDHTPVLTAPFDSPQAVTRACLGCHPDAAAQIMKTSHWLWLGEEVQVPGHPGKVRIGKRNLINNFCIAILGNERSCTKCHIGYGWADERFDFGRAENVDCLVCHERSGAYVKGEYGLPDPGTDLLAVARSVGFPTRESCSGCHSYGGGGQGVKHGDLDSSLVNPEAADDVHMGRLGFLCIDCHGGSAHALRGRAFSVGVEDSNGVGCTACHTRPAHRDERLNTHLRSVACQACHIPTFARKLPTKLAWDWSKAGDPSRPDDTHHYLKQKGEFVYGQDVVPEYAWFNLTMNRYLRGDPVDPARVTFINQPRGDRKDPAARIWPFKIHRALQPYDTAKKTLLTPVTGGAGGFWTSFNWDSALSLGAEVAGSKYSGQYGFAQTAMYWPLSHMVAPASAALRCVDCHGTFGRLDWRALGYDGDPLETGGRP